MVQTYLQLLFYCIQGNSRAVLLTTDRTSCDVFTLPTLPLRNNIPLLARTTIEMGLVNVLCYRHKPYSYQEKGEDGVNCTVTYKPYLLMTKSSKANKFAFNTHFRWFRADDVLFLNMKPVSFHGIGIMYPQMLKLDRRN